MVETIGRVVTAVANHELRRPMIREMADFAEDVPPAPGLRLWRPDDDDIRQAPAMLRRDAAGTAAMRLDQIARPQPHHINPNGTGHVLLFPGLDQRPSAVWGLGNAIADGTGRQVHFPPTPSTGNNEPLDRASRHHISLVTRLANLHRQARRNQGGKIHGIGYSRGGLNLIGVIAELVDYFHVDPEQVTMTLLATPLGGAPLARLAPGPVMAEMRAGAPVLTDLQATALKLRDRGVQVHTLSFLNDWVVPSAQAHLPGLPLWKVEGTSGHLSIHDHHTAQTLTALVNADSVQQQRAAA